MWQTHRQKDQQFIKKYYLWLLGKELKSNHYWILPALIFLLQADHYHFTLSWSRLSPLGDVTAVNSTNQYGVAYYNNVINSLISSGITPVVTLYHWDLPLELENYGGWLNSSTVDIFVNYAKFCFMHFGDRVRFFSLFMYVTHMSKFTIYFFLYTWP